MKEIGNVLNWCLYMKVIRGAFKNTNLIPKSCSKILNNKEKNIKNVPTYFFGVLLVQDFY
jgi:uncharacterized protein (DUF927 family)